MLSVAAYSATVVPVIDIAGARLLPPVHTTWSVVEVTSPAVPLFSAESVASGNARFSALELVTLHVGIVNLTIPVIDNEYRPVGSAP
ncbi:hypothetical protein D3C72_2236210 [compost metagenome]